MPCQLLISLSFTSLKMASFNSSGVIALVKLVATTSSSLGGLSDADNVQSFAFVWAFVGRSALDKDILPN
jgi:hypothetical protein